MRGTKQAKNEVSGCLKWLVPVLVPLFVIYISASVISTIYFRNQVVNYAETFIDFYMKQIETTVSNINYRMGMFVLGEDDSAPKLDSYIHEIKTTENMAFRNYYANKLRDVFRMYSMEYGNEYQFFAYFPGIDMLIGSNANDRLTLSQWEFYTSDICRRLENNSLIPNSGTSYWQLVEAENEMAYILKLYSMDEVYVGCFIRPSDLIWPLENAIEEGKCTVLLYDSHNKVVSGQEKPVQSIVVMERSFQTLPFKVEMFVSDYGLWQKTFFMHMTLALIGFAILCTILIVIYLLYRRVLRPVIHGLRREVYESEIKKQMMYMDYLKLQIEPHFYLNCLNFIYNMIDLRQYPQAASMASMTANYMRYLFNDQRDFVFIWEELEHIKHYVDIQKLRFGATFDCYIEQEPETKAVKIPPLLIQTFVENSIKYAMDLDKKLLLTVTVFSETMNNRPYINICVMDNGPGFGKELLEKLKDSRDYMEHENGHIGISNALKRLYYTYKEDAYVEFYNGPAKGAVIDIHIPPQIKEGEVEEQ